MLNCFCLSWVVCSSSHTRLSRWGVLEQRWRWFLQSSSLSSSYSNRSRTKYTSIYNQRQSVLKWLFFFLIFYYYFLFLIFFHIYLLISLKHYHYILQITIFVNIWVYFKNLLLYWCDTHSIYHIFSFCMKQKNYHHFFISALINMQIY